MAEKLTYAALEQRALALEKTAIAHKRAEEALQKRQELFQIIFKGSRDAVFITGQDARFAFVNPAACKLSGYPHDPSAAWPPGGFHHHDPSKQGNGI